MNIISLLIASMALFFALLVLIKTKSMIEHMKREHNHMEKRVDNLMDALRYHCKDIDIHRKR